MSTNENKCFIHMICVAFYKMVDGCEDREGNFKFIEDVQNYPDLWDFSSAAYKDTKTSRRKWKS